MDLWTAPFDLTTRRRVGRFARPLVYVPLDVGLAHACVQTCLRRSRYVVESRVPWRYPARCLPRCGPSGLGSGYNLDFSATALLTASWSGHSASLKCKESRPISPKKLILAETLLVQAKGCQGCQQRNAASLADVIGPWTNLLLISSPPPLRNPPQFAKRKGMMLALDRGRGWPTIAVGARRKANGYTYHTVCTDCNKVTHSKGRACLLVGNPGRPLKKK